MKIRIGKDLDFIKIYFSLGRCLDKGCATDEEYNALIGTGDKYIRLSYYVKEFNSRDNSFELIKSTKNFYIDPNSFSFTEV